jgi:TonB-linked SusC/RagA family outer membrane protein
MKRKSNLFAFVFTLAALAFALSPGVNANASGSLLQETIQGTVTDASTGEPLPGVNIVIRGTTQGAISDMNGSFSIEADAGDVLLISYVGYVTQEITVGDETTLTISLEPDVMGLDEIVVVGYGTQKRTEVTGAISTVDSDAITSVPVSTADQALQGRAAGVYVVNNGSPGTEPTIRIRGIGTVNDNTPLIVIDGVVAAGMGNLNPEDIESIQVLKDASTAAIYGSQGSNGVIIVTTKKGTPGRVKIDLDAYWGTQWNNNRYEVLNVDQYIEYAGSADVTTPPPVLNDPDRLGLAETNWQDEIYQNGFMHNYNLALSGGGENSVYRFSGGYTGQDGIVKTTGFERFNFRANSEFNKGRLRFGENLAVAFTDQVPLIDNGGRSLLEHAIKMAPYLPVYNENNPGGFQGPNSPYDGQDAENPIRIIELNSFDQVTSSIIGNAWAELDIVNGLKFRSVAGIEEIELKDNRFQPSYNDDNLGSTHSQDYAFITKNRRSYRSLIFTNSLNYIQTFAGAHNLEILALMEYSSVQRSGLNSNARNYITDEVQQVSNVNSTLSSSSSEYYRIGYVGRLNYNYDQKYLIAASYRADASSRFGANNRWGLFPSVAAGWRIHREAFLENASVLSNLKLRFSWGKAGNDKIGNYAYATTLTSDMNYVINNGAAPGTTVSGAANPDLKWEETTMTNFGIDLGLLGNQFTLAAEYYINRSDDLLMNLTTSPSLGIFSRAKSANAGSVETKGFEIQLGYNDFEGDFQWSASLNLGTYNSEVISLGGLDAIQVNQFENEGLTRLEVGMPAFYFYGWQFDGIFVDDAEAAEYLNGGQDGAQGGDFRIVDVAGPEDDQGNLTGPDGVIDANDRTEIGNPFPDVTMGLNLNFSYRGLDLNLFFQGTYGNDIYNTNIYDLEGMPRLFNAGVAVLDRWTPTNPSNTVPRPGTGRNVEASSRFIEDGSYTRLKNLTLGYTLPSSLFNNVISGIRIYVSAQNLITFTKYSGLDPEIGSYTTGNGGTRDIGVPPAYGQGYPVANFNTGVDYGNYPIPKSIIAGVQFSF